MFTNFVAMRPKKISCLTDDSDGNKKEKRHNVTKMWDKKKT